MRDDEEERSRRAAEDTELAGYYQQVQDALEGTGAGNSAEGIEDFTAGEVGQGERRSINKSYQRMHGEDVVTTPKTKKSNRVIKLPKFLCEEMKDCLKMFYDIKPGDRIFQLLSKHVLSTEMERGCKVAGTKYIRASSDIQ